MIYLEHILQRPASPGQKNVTIHPINLEKLLSPSFSFANASISFSIKPPLSYNYCVKLDTKSD